MNTSKQSTLVATQEPTAVTTPAKLLEMAVSQGAELDKLEKLMDLQERYESNEAKKAYANAMASFQADLQPIAKTREAHKGIKYADIDDIAQDIRPLMEENGLSYRFEQAQEEKNITVTCIVTHRAGHSERTTLTAMADEGGAKNAVQAIASTVTYLRRYTLTGALGITTGADDDDGGKPAVTVDELLEYNACLRENYLSVSAIKEALLNRDYSTAKEALAELDQDDARTLWRAPTKGGIFTTDERAQMKSNEFHAA